jgi:hypothetical protein
LTAFAVVVATLAVGQGPAAGADVASVRVAVRTTFGELVAGAQVTLTSVGPKERFTATGGEAEFRRIPFGFYDLEVRLPGFLPREERLRVYQSALVYQIGLELAPGHTYQRPDISGSLKPTVKGRSDLWVRAMALFSSDLVENAVDSAGTFTLVGMAPGRYLLFVFQKDKMLAVKPLEVLGGRQAVEVNLDSLGGRN